MKIIFNDENLKKLRLDSGQSEVMYSDENRIKFKGKTASICVFPFSTFRY